MRTRVPAGNDEYIVFPLKLDVSVWPAGSNDRVSPVRRHFFGSTLWANGFLRWSSRPHVLHLFKHYVFRFFTVVRTRCLPLEMVELEKHVKDLNLEQNPLPVLPDKWHLRFGPKEQASRPAGYTSNEVGRLFLYLSTGLL